MHSCHWAWRTSSIDSSYGLGIWERGTHRIAACLWIQGYLKARKSGTKYCSSSKISSKLFKTVRLFHIFQGSTPCSLNIAKTACFEDENGKIIATNSVQDDVSAPRDQALEDEEEGFSKDEQVKLLIDLMNECMKALFRTGILVRREVTYDRFQRALQRSRFTFPEQFDANYVEQKYPKLRGGAGRALATRLGRANAKRRQFIKYGRDHRTRLRLDMDAYQEIEPSIKATPSVNLEAPTERLSSKATTFVMSAENWNSGFLEAPKEDEDDSASLLTASTTFDSERSLKLVSLADIGPEGKHFECPLCFTLQSFRTERAWRYAVH